MILNEASYPHRLRRTVVRQIDRGLRTRPLLTVALVVVAAVLAASMVAVFLAAAAVVTILAALGFLGYRMARQMLLGGRPDEQPRDRAPSEPPTSMLSRYLASTEEFGRLADLAMTQDIGAPARGKRIRTAATDARRLVAETGDLVRAWQGSAEIAGCIYELHAACESLYTYLQELRTSGARRLSAAALRWRREDLGRRRDTLIEHLRQADFRGAARGTAEPVAAH